MSTSSRASRMAPILVLFALATLIPEFLSGSTPTSRAGQLLFESLLYGPAALLIRDFVRRKGLGYLSVIALGLAFGIIEEGILLQSLFNPGFLDLDVSFGRAFGVNWIWAEVIIVYHALWSIVIPIALTELLFPDKADRPWLNKPGIAVLSVLFALVCVAFHAGFREMSHFVAPTSHFIIAGAAALGLILLARFLPRNPAAADTSKSPSRPLVLITGFAGGFLWLVLLALVFTRIPGFHAWMAGVLGLCLLFGFGLLLRKWTSQAWSAGHRFLLASGATLAITLLGLNLALHSKNKVDLVVQIALLVVVPVTLTLLYRRLASAPAAMAHLPASETR